MTLRVVPLGTNGYIPTLGRHTASYCCSLSSRPFSWTPYRLARLLSSAHRPAGTLRLPEHHPVALSPGSHRRPVLPAGTWTRGTLHIYAPGRPLVDADPDDALDRL